MTASDDLRAVAEQYWEAKLEASPLFASFLGDHRYDDRADDLTAETEQRLRARWVDLRARAAAVAGDGLDDTDQSPAICSSTSWTTRCASRIFA